MTTHFKARSDTPICRPDMSADKSVCLNGPLGGIAIGVPSIARDVCGVVRPSVCNVCPSVTLVHLAKTVGRNEMPFGTDTCVVQSNIVLDRGPGPSREGEI